MIAALEGGEWSASRPGRTLPPGKNRYPFYRRLGRPQGRSGRVRKISSPPGFDPEPSSPSQSLCRLSYTAHKRLWRRTQIMTPSLCDVFLFPVTSSLQAQLSSSASCFNILRSDPLTTPLLMIAFKMFTAGTSKVTLFEELNCLCKLNSQRTYPIICGSAYIGDVSREVFPTCR